MKKNKNKITSDYAKIVYDGIKNINSWPSYIMDYLESRDQQFLKDLFSVSVKEITELDNFIYLPSSIADYVEDYDYCHDILKEELERLTEGYPIHRVFGILTSRHIRVDILRHKEFVNYMMDKYTEKAETSEDFKAMGDFIILNDKENEVLAFEMYKKSHAKAESFDDFRNLGWSIGFELKDPIWAFEVLMQGTEKIENSEQSGLLLSCANSIDMDETVFALIQRKCLNWNASFPSSKEIHK